MLIRDIIGTTFAGLAAAALGLAPGVSQAPSPASPGPAPGPAAISSGAPTYPVSSSVFMHDCPSTTESECRAVFLPPLADNDPDGSAHTSHQPRVRICGPLSEGMSLESATTCEDPGTGEEVEFFAFGCGDVNDCVEVIGNHFQVNWHIPADDECEGEEDDDDGDDDDGDEDCEEDDDGDDDGDDDDGDDDSDDEEDDEDNGEDEGIESGFYLIEAVLNGNPAGAVVVEVGEAAGGEEDDDDDGDDDGDDDDGDDDDDDGGECAGGSGQAPFFCKGETVPIKFRLHDKIVG